MMGVAAYGVQTFQILWQGVPPLHVFFSVSTVATVVTTAGVAGLRTFLDRAVDASVLYLSVV